SKPSFPNHPLIRNYYPGSFFLASSPQSKISSSYLLPRAKEVKRTAPRVRTMICLFMILFAPPLVTRHSSLDHPIRPRQHVRGDRLTILDFSIIGLLCRLGLKRSAESLGRSALRPSD